MSKISKIVGSKKNSKATLKELYKFRKSQNVRFSLQYICDKAGIPSKGYLSDVMNAKRPINTKYINPLCKVFDLSERQARIFRLKVLKDKETDPVRLEKIKLDLSVARKNLKVVSSAIEPGKFNPFIFAKVFCAIGITGQPAQARSISLVVKESIQDTFQALDALVEYGLLEKNKLGYFLTADQVVFRDQDSLSFQQAMIKSYLSNSEKVVEKWLPKIDESYLESSTISVDYQTYKKLLSSIKLQFSEIQSELETKKADRLVHFNIQIYPD